MTNPRLFRALTSVDKGVESHKPPTQLSKLSHFDVGVKKKCL